MDETAAAGPGLGLLDLDRAAQGVAFADGAEVVAAAPARHGRARLADVAEVAQLQAPAIYSYFPSREELIEEVMWSGIASMTDHVQEQLDALPADTAALDRIEVAVETHLRYQLEISDYTTAAIRNAGQLPDTMRARYEAEAWSSARSTGGGVVEPPAGFAGRRHPHRAEPGAARTRRALTSPEAYIVDAVRTPVGRRGGGRAQTLQPISAPTSSVPWSNAVISTRP